LTVSGLALKEREGRRRPTRNYTPATDRKDLTDREPLRQPNASVSQDFFETGVAPQDIDDGPD